MLETIVAFIALFGIIGLVLFKAYNITNILAKKGSFPKQTVFFTLIGILLCWVLYFLAFAGSLQYSETMITGAETTVTTTSAFVSFAFFMPLTNFFLILGIMLTVVEVIAFYASLQARGGLTRD